MNSALATAVAAVALAFPASSAAVQHNAPVGDGGGGACTVYATGQYLYNTALTGYAWNGSSWVWGYFWRGTWYCDGSHWWGF